ncbi:RdgB/HAM1 family non-canonical purine NTP pyrophosphatase [Pseudanabaena sp. PCC 6802]|uniref:RdgB/HAM1 family non-canonical purine NTP pyrophosphatase n=1 Tax=Pseudanabaena sp. PCC 6802 TaxID=118173 RepID=UPI000346B10A|nr:RdgB/HAM1 family non-canonical purine NTP pyrophosphatase [Pseudanabaena sp. PCC 6802]
MTLKEVKIKNLVIASGNRGKVEEFKDYLNGLGFSLLPKPDEIEVEETGATFIENAYLKASQVAIATQEWALADDSGLEVAALNGAPGVFSARYGKNDRERIARILAELGDRTQREAQFVCAIAIASPDGKIAIDAVGICKGEILYAPAGDRGFGYDPIFYVAQYNLTFAQMSPQLKAEISHRGKALEILRPKLKDLAIS